jgi:hypothetical protein
MASPGKLRRDRQPWRDAMRIKAKRTPNAFETKEIFKVMGTFHQSNVPKGEDLLSRKKILKEKTAEGIFGKDPNKARN